MGSTELEEMAAMAAGMDEEDLEQLMQVLVDNSPPETLSLINLTLFTKTNSMEYMDRALRLAEGVAAATASDQNYATGLGILGPMLSRSAESFLRATQLGLANILGVLMQDRFNFAQQGIQGQALLHEACKAGDISVAHVLLKRGFDPNARNTRNETALMTTAEVGNDVIARLLLEYKADIEAEDQDGDSALQTAAYHGCESVARVLLENGAKPAVCGGSGHTPMQWALNQGHFGVAQLLLDFNAFSDLADDSSVPLCEISGDNLCQQIEVAQEIMFPASLTVGWLDRIRFVVAAGEGSDHDLELIEPGPGGTMTEPYVAISYCWGRTWSSEDPLSIRVPSRNGTGSTEVRKARASRDILLRSLEYAAAKGVKRIWIDQECIHQDDAEDKKDALQNMHLVYRRAKTTLVLLDRHVRTLPEIASLHDTILGVGKCQDLKARINSDRWFTRAWTCQEYGVTRTANLRYLVGWDNDLDVSGYMWELASVSFNSRSKDIMQNLPRSWEFSHREIGGIAFEAEKQGEKQNFSNITLSSEVGVFGIGGEDEIIYTLINDGVEEMYWWKHGLSFRFGARERNIHPDVAVSDRGNPHSSHSRQEWSKLQMNILAALVIQRNKACTIFSDKLAILGNLTGYPYRLHPVEAFQKQLSFSACVLAMALFNGDLSPLFRHDWTDLVHNGETDNPRSLFPSQNHLYMLAGGCSAHSRNRAQVTTGSKCLVLGGKLVVKGILWRIVPFVDLEGLEKTTEPIAKEDTKDPVRFYFFQMLVRRLVALKRIDLLELVVVSVMRRQLTSPLELVHLLNELQAWSCNERHWPTNITDESFLEQTPTPKGIEVVLSNGKKKKVVQYMTYRDARGLDYAVGKMESDDSQPTDLLSHIHHAVLHKRPLALGECKVGDLTLVSLFVFDPSEHQWVLTPVNELEYEFGKNPWLHMHPKETFWCVEKGEEMVSDAGSRRASKILKLGADEEKHCSPEILKVVTSGSRSSITGIWSPRLSRRGILTIGDDGSWNMIPLGQVAKYFWLTGV